MPTRRSSYPGECSRRQGNLAVLITRHSGKRRGKWSARDARLKGRPLLQANGERPAVPQKERLLPPAHGVPRESPRPGNLLGRPLKHDEGPLDSPWLLNKASMTCKASLALTIHQRIRDSTSVDMPRVETDFRSQDQTWTLRRLGSRASPLHPVPKLLGPLVPDRRFY
jgi:hypothetical protein